jgi:hypothetical protein
MKQAITPKKTSDMRQVALNANAQELEALERIKQHYSRTSDADMIRFLIIQEDQKILNQKSPTGEKA